MSHKKPTNCRETAEKKFIRLSENPVWLRLRRILSVQYHGIFSVKEDITTAGIKKHRPVTVGVFSNAI